MCPFLLPRLCSCDGDVPPAEKLHSEPRGRLLLCLCGCSWNRPCVSNAAGIKAVFLSCSDADSFCRPIKVCNRSWRVCLLTECNFVIDEMAESINQCTVQHIDLASSQMYERCHCGENWHLLCWWLIWDLWLSLCYKSLWRLKGMAQQWPKEPRSQTFLYNNCAKHSYVVKWTG